jgi:hypothetical protein
MGRFTGFRCDVCGTVKEGSGREKGDVPMGWMSLVVKTTEDLTSGMFLLCSNKCLKKIATERYKVDLDSKRPRTVEPRVGRYDLHVREHEGKAVTDPTCPYCESDQIAS